MSQTLETVYGLHAVSALLQRHPERIKQIWLQDNRADARMQHLLELAESAKILILSATRQQLDERTEGVHQGVLAEVTPSQPYTENMLQLLLESHSAPPFLLVLDGVTDPHNLGACLRSADAAGVQAVIVPKDRAATLNATVRKVACGAAEVVPLIAVSNLARCLDKLKQRGLWLVGADGEAECDLWQQDLRGPLALVMGAEGKGLRRLTRERCDWLVRLPMQGSVSSLNVSVATGICLFEALRQRTLKPTL